MDRIERYRQILRETVNRHARYAPANGDIKTHALCDASQDEYLVMDIGWNEKQRRIHDVVLHFRLDESGKIYVENDGTDAEIVRELLSAGIPQEDILLTFRSPQPHTVNDTLFS